MTTLSAEIDGVDRVIAGLRAAPEIIDAANAEAMTKSVFFVEAAVKARTPRITGRLFSSINGRLVDPSQGRISTNVHYAKWVEGGRGPVVAKPGHFLKFKQNGETIYRRSVGPAAGRFMFREGLLASMGAIKAFFQDAAKHAAAAITRA